MNFPKQNDFIDIHTHGAEPSPGIFSVETLMAHEERIPLQTAGIAYTAGIHPWNLNNENHDRLLSYVKNIASSENIIAVGEAGFDKIKGPAMDLQRKTFEEQVNISEKFRKPVVIHCVRAWEELISAHKKLNPAMPWLVHGFRGKSELGLQLISKGMYLSFWFDYAIRPEASPLLKSLPCGHIFLETDGSGADIRDIYFKVAKDLGLTLDELKSQIFKNYNSFFKLKP
ncbi:MAG: TatD family hydrolase [Bacteroidales bacterium]